MQSKLSVVLALLVVGGLSLNQAQAESKDFSAAKLDKTGAKSHFRSVCYSNCYCSPYCSPCSSCCNYCSSYCSPCYSSYCSPCCSSYCSPCCDYGSSYCSPCSSYCSSCCDYGSFGCCSGHATRHSFKACHARLYPKGNQHHH